MKFAMVFAAAVVGSLGIAGAAQAAPIPPGSYQQSCTEIYADWTTLTATCRIPDGGRNYTTLRNYRYCDGDIANVYGRLQCISDDQSDDNDDGWLPRGSYRETCRDIGVNGGTLTAECQDRNGRWRYTELAAFRSCDGDITNSDGMLRCRRGGNDDDDHDGTGLPGGSWRFSCRDGRIYGTILYAVCRDTYGSWRDTSLDLRQCGDNVSNVNGRLACGSTPHGAITLYRHAYFVGKALTFTTSVPDLNRYGFGNVASSVAVQSGLWELCDRPYYRGQCVVVSRTRANLRTIGFTDRAESVRRLR